MRQVLVLNDFPTVEDAKLLGPNSGTRIFARAKRIEQIHDDVAMLARAQGIEPVNGFAVIRPSFTFPIRRARDDDNAATGVTKAVRDGLTRAGIFVADDAVYLRQLPAMLSYEKGVRKLELEIMDVGYFAVATFAMAQRIEWTQPAKTLGELVEFLALFDPLLSAQIGDYLTAPIRTPDRTESGHKSASGEIRTAVRSGRRYGKSAALAAASQAPKPSELGFLGSPPSSRPLPPLVVEALASIGRVAP